MQSESALVFDVGGTTTRLAVVEAGSLGGVIKFDTPPDPEEWLSLFEEKARSLTNERRVGAFCGGATGTVAEGVVVSGNKSLPLWKAFPLVSRISGIFDTNGVLYNDAELVGLGEYYFGAGKGDRNMLYVTVSTGVGGAHIIDGRVERGRYNAEFGHQNVDGVELEDLISGTAVRKKYGIHPKDLSDKAALDELADLLAKGLSDTILHFFPDSVVVGGSMIVGKNGIPLERVSQTLRRLLSRYYPTTPELKKAALGDIGGLYGGVAHLEFLA